MLKCRSWAAVLVWLGHHRKIKPPGLFALYVFGYSAYRIFEESLRIDSSVYIFGLRLNLYIASALAVIGAVWFYRSQRRPEAANPAGPIAADAAGPIAGGADPVAAGPVAAQAGAGAAQAGAGAAQAGAGAAQAGAGAAQAGAGAGPPGDTPVSGDPAPPGNSESRQSQDSEQTTS